mmetsp:Transcript_8621/g.15259  ORF Transcript_8621/g.15259 Transcript_8621/m.15259 type:complete len:232 (+) Transcript_8621:419-1114(+)
MPCKYFHVSAMGEVMNQDPAVTPMALRAYHPVRGAKTLEPPGELARPGVQELGVVIDAVEPVRACLEGGFGARCERRPGLLDLVICFCQDQFNIHICFFEGLLYICVEPVVNLLPPGGGVVEGVPPVVCHCDHVAEPALRRQRERGQQDVEGRQLLDEPVPGADLHAPRGHGEDQGNRLCLCLLLRAAGGPAQRPPGLGGAPAPARQQPLAHQLLPEHFHMSRHLFKVFPR